MTPPWMGSLVMVNAEFRRVVVDGKAHWEAHDITPRAGWIVGMRCLQTGHQEQAFEYGTSFVESAPRKTALIVAYWPTMRPVPVARYSYTQYAQPRSPARSVEWSDEARQEWRDGAARQKRDEKGRFVR